MRHVIRRAIEDTLRSTAASIVRTPVEVTLAFVFALGASLVVEDVLEMEMFLRGAAPLMIAWILTFSLSVLHALRVLQSQQRWALSAMYVAAMGLFSAFGFDPDLASGWWRWAGAASPPATCPRRCGRSAPGPRTR